MTAGPWLLRVVGRRVSPQRLLGVMDVFIILIAVMTLQEYTYAKTYQIVCFEYVLFNACPLYLNKAVLL